jgi:drug/metabolite transporter (DMT)-like permease
VLRLVGRGLVNPSILAGILFEAIFFAGLLILMGHRDISFVWPLTSLSFVMTTFAAVLVLKEHVSATRWAGVALIVLGAAFITWSEKENAPERTATVKARQGH